MTTLVVVGIVIICVAGAAFVWMRRPPAAVRRENEIESKVDATWTGDDFGSLSESGRCDLVFAVAALDDDRSRQLLARALDDPSEPVALAAAHALAKRGDGSVVGQYLANRPGERARRLASALELLTPD